MRTIVIYFLILVCFKVESQQIGNFVKNGSFEACLNCQSYSPPLRAKYWDAIDSTKYYGRIMTSLPPSITVPQSSFCYQWPHSGNNYMLSSLLAIMGSASVRGYPRNELKQNLISGKVYCVKLYYSITNQSTHGINSFGIYFGGTNLDTIKICDKAITYLTPQIQNPPTNFLTDTLNWVAFTGTFTADGTEKYMVLGNFKSDNATDTVLINPTNLPTIANEILYDDVSCIEVNLPAYAGPDKSITPGDSIYIGRENDFAVDKGCIWYKLPNMTTPIDTISGLWVKPTVTTTYVVRQELDCSSTKWDTVVVHMNLVGLEKQKFLTEELKIYPIPAQDFLELKISNIELFKEFNSITISNNLGQVISEEEIDFNEKTVKINTVSLQSGIYFITIRNTTHQALTKKLVIAR